MATLPLVPAQIETLVQRNTVAMLGLGAPQSATDPVFTKVRIGWQQQGQPAWGITDDVTFVRCIEIDDEYNRIRDVSYTQSTVGDPPVTTTTKVTNYTRVWRVFWSVYGPNSFDNARKLRTRLFDQDIHDLFSASQLYLVTDPSAPIRAPEQKVEMGAWWERVDFSARFNEFVTETYPVSVVESVEVIVSVAAGVIADVVILPEGVSSSEPPPTQYTPPYPVYIAPEPVHVAQLWWPESQPNGSTAVFLFQGMAPSNLDSVEIFLGGMLQCPNVDYTIAQAGAGIQVTFASPPASESTLLAYY